MDLEAKVQQRKNPRETAGLLSIAFFWWMNSLLALGYRKDLELEDLYEPRKEDKSERTISSLPSVNKMKNSISYFFYTYQRYRKNANWVKYLFFEEELRF